MKDSRFRSCSQMKIMINEEKGKEEVEGEDDEVFVR